MINAMERLTGYQASFDWANAEQSNLTRTLQTFPRIFMRFLMGDPKMANQYGKSPIQCKQRKACGLLLVCPTCSVHLQHRCSSRTSLLQYLGGAVLCEIGFHSASSWLQKCCTTRYSTSYTPLKDNISP